MFCCSFFIHFFCPKLFLFLKLTGRWKKHKGKKKTLVQSAHRAVTEQTLRELWESVWPCLCCFHGSWKRRREEGWEEAERSGGAVRQRVGQRGLHLLRFRRRGGWRSFVFRPWGGSVADAARWEKSLACKKIMTRNDDHCFLQGKHYRCCRCKCGRQQLPFNCSNLQHFCFMVFLKTLASFLEIFGHASLSCCTTFLGISRSVGR